MRCLIDKLRRNGRTWSIVARSDNIVEVWTDDSLAEFKNRHDAFEYVAGQYRNARTYQRSLGSPITLNVYGRGPTEMHTVSWDRYSVTLADSDGKQYIIDDLSRQSSKISIGYCNDCGKVIRADRDYTMEDHYNDTHGAKLDRRKGTSPFMTSNTDFSFGDKKELYRESDENDSSDESLSDESNVPEEIVRIHKQYGGATYNLEKGDLGGQDFYAVSIFPDRTRILNTLSPTPEQIDKFIQDNQEILSDSRVSIGTWRNMDGQTELDLSVTVPDIQKALDLAKYYNQKAITHLLDYTSIPVGGKGVAEGDLPSDKERLDSIENHIHARKTRRLMPKPRHGVTTEDSVGGVFDTKEPPSIGYLGPNNYYVANEKIPPDFLQKLADESGLDLRGYDLHEIALGYSEEKEHDVGKYDVVDSPVDLLKITLAHLEEDPYYYSQMKSRKADITRTPYYCRVDHTRLMPHQPSEARKVCPDCGAVYTAKRVLSSRDIVAQESGEDEFGRYRVSPKPVTPPLENTGVPEVGLGQSAVGGGRVLSRHELIQEAEHLIRNSLHKGVRIGTYDLTQYMSQEYGNRPEEILQAVEKAWEQVNFEMKDEGMHPEEVQPSEQDMGNENSNV